MQEVLVSVIIPVYNVEEYLRECLDSVINQTENLRKSLVYKYSMNIPMDSFL